MAALKGDKTLAELACSMTCTRARSRSGSSSWRSMPRPCSAGGKIKTAVESPVDVKALHAKIGQPTLENDFVTVAAHNTGSHGNSWLRVDAAERVQAPPLYKCLDRDLAAPRVPEQGAGADGIGTIVYVGSRFVRQ